MTARRDDVPHTGGMGYADGVDRVPAAAISILAAERLAEALAHDPHLKVELKLSCETLPDVPSSNVLGETRRLGAAQRGGRDRRPPRLLGQGTRSP